MSAARHSPMSLEDFLLWENQQELRFEFDGLGAVAMAGGTAAHAAIRRNLLIALGIPLRGQKCQAFGSELKIQVAGSIRYPDAFVVCSPVPDRSTLVTDPVVVFEIVSESSISEDLITKNQEYRATPSVMRYVVLQQTHPGAVVFSRKGDDWVAEILSGGSVLRMPELGMEVGLDGLYAGLVLGLPERVSLAAT